MKPETFKHGFDYAEYKHIVEYILEEVNIMDVKTLDPWVKIDEDKLIKMYEVFRDRYCVILR